MSVEQVTLRRTAGAWEVMVAGVALVVAASTLVSDFIGYFTLGAGFVVAVAIAFVVNLLLGLSAADLAAAFPRAGALYAYASRAVPGPAARDVGVFLALAFVFAFPLAAAGEVSAGAFALERIVGIPLPIEAYIAMLLAASVLPCLLGLRGAAWTGAVLLVAMLGIRWGFGVAGFAGWSAAPAWSFENLASGGPWRWTGEHGVLSEGLALALWGFVGIEFACALAEEVREPRTAMPRGIVGGLVLILATSLVMGLGVTGTMPLAAWRETALGPLGELGAAPQLAVGRVMFGAPGEILMAVASVAATLGSLMVAFAAIPRLLFGMARDGRLPMVLSRPFGRLNRRGVPAAATVATLVGYGIPAIASHDVVSWIYAAAYVWVLLYVAYHVLAVVRRVRGVGRPGALPRWAIAVPVAGIPSTLACVYFAFAGGHLRYGGGALVVLGAALAATVVSARSRRGSGSAAPLEARGALARSEG